MRTRFDGDARTQRLDLAKVLLLQRVDGKAACRSPERVSHPKFVQLPMLAGLKSSESRL